jgi:hypothetical protein
MSPLTRRIVTNELNELSRVKESKSEALHSYNIGVAREPLERAYGYDPIGSEINVGIPPNRAAKKPPQTAP